MAAVVAQETFSTGAIVERMVSIRDERREIKERDSELYQVWHDLEALLIDQLDAQGVTKVATDTGTATLTETVLPRVENWDAFYDHIKDTDSLYLLQRRVSSGPFREHLEAGRELPGVSSYLQRSISLRKQ